MIFDSHAHYDDEAFDGDRDDVLKAVKKDGVGYIMDAGSNIESSRISAQLSRKYDFLYAAAGIHPENAEEFDENSIDILRSIAKFEKVRAIGEIGLDYYCDDSNKELQKKVFEEQLGLAIDLGLPVIVHDREAHEDTYNILKKYGSEGLRAVLHCYSGSCELAGEYIDMGFYLGFTGVITFKNARKPLEVLSKTPIEKILIETDCPYLAPVPFRGKRNDSRYLKYTARKACEIMNMDFDSFTETTCRNAREFFRI